jgi:hypothetical protein
MAHDVIVADTRTRLEALHPASERERTGSAENPRLREVLVMTGYTAASVAASRRKGKDRPRQFDHISTHRGW